MLRSKAKNSNDQFRDSRQMDKAIMEMASRSHDSATRALMVTLLNENKHEVKAAHESLKGVGMKKEWQDSMQEEVRELLDNDPESKPADATATSSSDVRRSERSRKTPQSIYKQEEYRKT